MPNFVKSPYSVLSPLNSGNKIVNLKVYKKTINLYITDDPVVDCYEGLTFIIIHSLNSIFKVCPLNLPLKIWWPSNHFALIFCPICPNEVTV